MKPLGIAILGGTGYGAGELLRLLSQHPNAEVVSICSSSQVGKAIADAHPHLAKIYQQKFIDKPDLAELKKFQQAIVFCSLPHGASIAAIRELLTAAGSIKLKIVDLSGDLRLKNEGAHTSAYADVPYSNELREKFVYGLTELNREAIAHSQFIANPGCYATTCALSVLPLLGGTKIDGVISFDAKSGSSGAGRSLSESLHHPLRSSSMTAYKVLTHRHEPEILETLTAVAGTAPEITFTPQLLPVARGIFVTTHLRLERESSTEKLLAQYEAFYKKDRFVRVSLRMPELGYVVGSNFCDISLMVRGRDVVIAAALDNLVKGMAGQAIQNMNVMCGLPEEAGLWAPALGLV